METKDNDSTKRKVALGKRLVSRARAWIASNPQGWMAFRAACAMCQRRYGCVSRDNVYTALRDAHEGVSDRAAWSRAHDLFSALVRYAKEEEPGLVIRRSRCSVDLAYPDRLPEL